MYNILPFILILLGLTVIIFIVAKKFPLVANIDIESIPREKEAKVKQQIISNRLKRNIVKITSRLENVIKIFFGKSLEFFRFLYKKLVDAKEEYKKSIPLTPEKKEENLRELYAQALELKNKEDYEEAEKKLIEIISLDSKNIPAFKALGENYIFVKKYNEAKETFKHVLKLLENEEEDASEVYFDLAIIEKELEKYAQSLHYLKKALKTQPNNPRYLDATIEVALIIKDKITANEAFCKLRESNPENQKLGEVEEKINSL